MRTIILFILLFLSFISKAQLWKEVVVEKDFFNRNEIDLICYQDKDRIFGVNYNGNLQTIYLSINGGNVFKPQFNILFDEWGAIQHLRFIDSDTLLLITGNGILKKALDPFHTPEFLIKYAEYDSAYPSQSAAFFYFEEGDSAIISARHVFKTYDGGKTWVNLPKGINVPSGFSKTGTYISNVGVLFNTNGLSLYRSNNFSNTWDTVFDFSPLIKDWFIYVNAFSFINEKVGYTLLGQDVYKTTDGGYNWDSISYFKHGGISNQDIKFFNENKGYSIYEGLTSIYKTKDGGISWEEEFEFPERFSKSKQLFYFGDSLFFVLNGNKVYKRETTQLSVQQPNKNNLNANIYPNPFTNTINIQLTSLNENVSQISIVDLQGRVLKTSNTREQYISLNLPELATGIYFLRIENGNAIITKRIVKQ